MPISSFLEYRQVRHTIKVLVMGRLKIRGELK